MIIDRMSTGMQVCSDVEDEGPIGACRQLQSDAWVSYCLVLGLWP